MGSGTDGTDTAAFPGTPRLPCDRRHRSAPPQVLQAVGWVGIGTETAMPRGLDHPPTASVDFSTSATSATGGLESQQDPRTPSLSPEGLGTKTGSAAGESEEGAAGHGDPSASEESSEQLISASGAKAAPSQQGQRQGSVPGAKPGLSSLWTRKKGSSAELPIPASAEEEAVPSIPSTKREQGGDAQAPEGSPLPPWSPPTAQGEPSDSSAPQRCHGTLADLSELYRVLQLMEELVETMSPRHRVLYQGQPSGTAELPSGAGGLAQGDLEAMEAAVLWQLQALSQRKRSGSVPLENAGGAAGRAGCKEHSSYRDTGLTAGDAEALRIRLSDHGLFLKQHRVQLPERVAEMFEKLLAPGMEEQDSQALPVLPGERGDRSPVEGDESSLSLLSTPTNIKRGKQVELAGREPGRDHGHDGPKGSDSLETHSKSSSSLDGSAPPFSRTELRKETVTAIKSKAFWGESDDSSSELEVALRPQTHSADSDDFDDFYD